MAKECGELVLEANRLAGVDFRIVDIGLRMLTPEELLRAQFGHHAAGYRIDGLNKKQAVKMIGNSVCPDVPEALVRANVRLRVVRFGGGRAGE